MNELNTILLLITIAIFTTSVILDYQAKSSAKKLINIRLKHSDEMRALENEMRALENETFKVLVETSSLLVERNSLILDAIESGAEINITRK